jgi:hypothetical protein
MNPGGRIDTPLAAYPANRANRFLNPGISVTRLTSSNSVGRKMVIVLPVFEIFPYFFQKLA